ncbi:MAG TPA: hypothetical protein PLU30_22430 [Verrucomicrobiae bacterium]|nr:hypothetical protein [Verrucomicrobiae bacterium]
MNARGVNDPGELPRFVRDMLGACPRSGEGVHRWLFRCARLLHGFYDDRAEMAELLAAASSGCGRSVGAHEILGAIDGSAGCAWRPGMPHAAPPAAAWPRPDAARIESVLAAAGGFGLVDLWEASPIRFPDELPQTEGIIDALFPADALLCCGWSKGRFETRPRQGWRGLLSELALIVPSPMSAPAGRRLCDGLPSAHTLDNTGPRRFLVVEFDRGEPDAHAAILAHLSGFLPLVLAVHSGGKSLHGWFVAAGLEEGGLRRFMRHAVILGADPATWGRSQFVRVPDGRREDGSRQCVFYFDPGVCDAAQPNPQA